VHNALYWIEEFHLDGLRFDAIDHIHDDSDPEIVVEIAERIRQHYPGRDIHLTTEDARNITHLHERGPNGEVRHFTAEWNDDFHNAIHVAATGETDGYYADFSEHLWDTIARALAEGFVFQGECTARSQTPRGVSCTNLPPTAFVDFIQNHDQVGNRAFGERLTGLAEASMVELLLAMLLLSPHIPLLFMGEEWGETRPFSFFTDFHGELADRVREGRRREFAAFQVFHHDVNSLRQVPDPNAFSTFDASRLDWEELRTGRGVQRFALVSHLIALRQKLIVPRLRGAPAGSGHMETVDEGLICTCWRLEGGTLRMTVNFDNESRPVEPISGSIVYASSPEARDAVAGAGFFPSHAIVVAFEGDHQALARAS
jgi:malto-oligosyltrehalose trehalohydrolase